MTANSAPNSIRSVGMDSSSGHSTSINNGVGSSSGRADACNTEEGSAALSGAATQHCDYKSSPAP
ncbi:hypothetical protein FBU31_006563, partial [Coemansia sp. 'formosensis']